MYEKQLKQLNPTIPHITYDISVRYNFVMVGRHIYACCLFVDGKWLVGVLIYMKGERKRFSLK